MTRTVVHFIGSLDRGGAESVALDLCRAIPETELRQVFVCLSGRRGTLAAEFEVAGARVVAPEGGLLRKATAALAVLRAERPAVVQSHVSLASGWLLALAKGVSVDVRIARMHSQGDGRPNTITRRLYRGLSRQLLGVAATHVLSVTHAAESFAAGGKPERWRTRGVDVRTVPNGVDLGRFHPSTSTSASIGHRVPVVLHVGRADPAKNRAALAPIAKALKRKTSSELWVAGTNVTDDLGAHLDDLVILGPRADIDEVYRSADLLLLPSNWEGLPGVVLEALASGIPVVASDISGLREVAERLVGISLVPLAAPPEVWAEEIARALTQDHPSAGEIVTCVRESEFNLVSNVEQWRVLWGLSLSTD